MTQKIAVEGRVTLYPTTYTVIIDKGNTVIFPCYSTPKPPQKQVRKENNISFNLEKHTDAVGRVRMTVNPDGSAYIEIE